MIDPFVSVDWVRSHREQVIIADVRLCLDGSSPRAAYDAGHVPGATFVDLERWLSGAPSPQDGRHPLPTPEHFAAGMGAVGIGDHATVVAYDDAGGVFAARLVWMLRTLGRDAALMDGGLTAWPEDLETDDPELLEAQFTPQPWPPEALASIDDAQDPHNVVLDARPRERFDGGADALDPRAGHIPGARSLPCRDHLQDGKLLPVDELLAAAHAAGVERGSAVVSYCGSGVTACHNLLVLEHLGLGSGRLYPGSWSQYSHTDLPAETSA
ncbi:MAG: sulfurtransferase [Solirubrobacteraceae bacterium]|nr:sulfurtransferase [Solirubrobacteraceae bacterium]